MLLAVAALLLLVDGRLLFEKPRPGQSEAQIYLWSYFELVDVKSEGSHWPSVAADGSWLDGNGRQIDVKKLEERQARPNTDGPSSLIKISLGADPSYGHFLKSLHALALARICTYAVSEGGRAGAVGRDIPVQSIAEVRDPETGAVTPCMPRPVSLG